MIVHSKYGISFDHTSHIKQTIIAVWFPKPTDLLGVCDIPLQTNTTYEHDIKEALLVPPKNITLIEHKYGRLIFNAHIGKYLHVE